MNIEIRTERVEDVQAIRQVTNAAFKHNPHASGTEEAIIEALRNTGALTISLVAVNGNDVVGHIAFSPVMIGGQDLCWFGLGPVSVVPDLHGRGIGSALIRKGLARLKQMGGAGCVLLGDPAFYQRFGFENDPALQFDDAPAKYFLKLSLAGTTPSGAVVFHKGFLVA